MYVHSNSKDYLKPSTNHFSHTESTDTPNIFEDFFEDGFSSPIIFIDDTFKDPRSSVNRISNPLTSDESNGVHPKEPQGDSTVKHPGLIRYSRKIAKVFTIHKEQRHSIIKKPHSTTRQRNRQTRWTPEENERVRCLIGKFGENWTVIAKALDNRTGKQVRDRYNNFLRSDILTTRFTPQEDALLSQLYEELGNRWVQIAERMPGRTECQVKNRYYGHLKKNGSDEICSFRKREGSPAYTQQEMSCAESESKEVIDDLTNAISYAVQNTNHQEEESDEFRKLAKIILEKNLRSESAVQEGLVKVLEKQSSEIQGEQLELETELKYIGLDPKQRIQELLKRKAVIEYFYKKVVHDLNELEK